jgi:hypothetical protein
MAEKYISIVATVLLIVAAAALVLSRAILAHSSQPAT